jgi:hypothetical protein
MSRERLQVRHFYHKAEHRTTRFLEVFALDGGVYEVTLRDVRHYNRTETSILCWKFDAEALALTNAVRIADRLFEAGYKEMRL